MRPSPLSHTGAWSSRTPHPEVWPLLAILSYRLLGRNGVIIGYRKRPSHILLQKVSRCLHFSFGSGFPFQCITNIIAMAYVASHPMRDPRPFTFSELTFAYSLHCSQNGLRAAPHTCSPYKLLPLWALYMISSLEYLSPKYLQSWFPPVIFGSLYKCHPLWEPLFDIFIYNVNFPQTTHHPLPTNSLFPFSALFSFMALNAMWQIIYFPDLFCLLSVSLPRREVL